MIYEHAYVTVDAGNRTEFEDVFTRAKKYLLDANGGKTAEIVRSVDHPGLYLLRVGWDSVEDHTELFASSTNGKNLGEAIGHFFIETPQVIHFEDTAV
ncbi:antibiotic biosynthesis monooxygenase family protein [Rhodococcus sp. T2V]|uniref:antibiotic biosynthesis monooxygenase family protein n=1 Tax=Rhodococcus sp. T2V TaxID=3034164 RepID=UPI0023E0D6BC|nr:antibiotic biosynthesis monooxygenase [Rhodococcus sp. T2V]MDF3307543.1 antibiotic biosynthesis monooxygenase [Rhodococcus sp. T2V]